mgnify:CR=1 FL=1
MKVVFMGTPEFSVPILRALVENGYEVAGGFTQPDKPKGRGGKVQMTPVKEYALSQNIPVFQPLKIRKDGLDDLKSLAPDLCVTAAFGQILSQEVLDVPKIGTVNVHTSLLPRHRGAAPVQWTVWQGETVTGVTSMYMAEGLDTGDMLLTEKVAIAPDDNFEAVHDKLGEAGARVLGGELLIETLRRIEAGDCPRQKQDESRMTYDPKITKEMGEMDFTETTAQCVNRVRAMSPWPCGYVTTETGALKIWKARAAQGCGQPGTVLRADRKKGLIVATGDGAVELCEIQAPGAKRMEAKAYLLGHAIPEGQKLSEAKL